MEEILKTSDYIEFRDGPLSTSGLTKTWTVVNRTSIDLGVIKWSGPWRRYVFFPATETFFDADCMFTIAEFADTKTKEHYGKP